MQLAWLHGGAKAKAEFTALGDLNGDGIGDAATVTWAMRAARGTP
jgi:hypothetical protein